MIPDWDGFQLLRIDGSQAMGHRNLFASMSLNMSGVVPENDCRHMPGIDQTLRYYGGFNVTDPFFLKFRPEHV